MEGTGQDGGLLTRGRVGAVLAPLSFLALWLLPLPLEDVRAHRLAAIFVAIVIMWVTEVVPIAVTALLIAPAMVVAGVTGAEAAFAPYADPLLFLFVGAFMIARSMTLHGLDRRLAMGIVALPGVGDRPALMRAAFMLAAVLLSMWISNTATMAILAPILIGLVDRENANPKSVSGAVLAVAYACSLGGLGTPVGSPPNLIAMGFLRRQGGFDMSFFDWVAIALPAALIMMVALYGLVAWLLPTSALPVPTDRATATPPERRWSRGEITTAIAFGVAIAGWMVPGILKTAGVAGAAAVNEALPGGAVALLAASILFMVPDIGNGRRVLPWAEAAQIDWGIIMLFGGGISLGTQLVETHLAEALARGFVGATGVTDLWTLTALATVFTIFFTETCSNTATSNIVSPIVIAIATELGISAVPPVLAVGLAASCAFMLPIATGPNAIAYGTGRVPMTHMMRAGLWLNLACAVLIFAVLRILCPLYGWS